MPKNTQSTSFAVASTTWAMIAEIAEMADRAGPADARLAARAAARGARPSQRDFSSRLGTTTTSSHILP